MFSLLTRSVRSTGLMSSLPLQTRSFSLGSAASSLSLVRRQQISPLSNPTSILSTQPSTTSQLASTETQSIFSNIFSLGGQRRWKARGNNYQPNTYKRKKTLGFMSRMRSKTGRKIVLRRREKGRWYLSH